MSKIMRAFQEQQQVLRRIVAKYRSNPADVDEIVQETFLKGYSAELKTKIDQPDHFLMRVAKNLAINHAQRKSNTLGVSIEELEPDVVLKNMGSFSHEDQLDASQKLLALFKALGTIPAEQREAFALRRIDGLRFKEISTRLGVSVSTLEKRVASAMIAIHSNLRSQGYDPVEFGASSRAGKERPPSVVAQKFARSVEVNKE